MKLLKKNHVETLSSLKEKREEVEKLKKEREKEISEVAQEILGDPMDVKGPTSDDLEAIMLKVAPLIEEFSTLQEQINTLRNNAQMAYKETVNRTTTDKTWQIKLEEIDPYYENLSKTYLSLRPKVDKALAELTDITAKANHKPISDVYLNAFSSMNKLALGRARENEKAYKAKREECVAMLEKLKILLEQTNIRFNNARDHLNAIDNNIGRARNTSYVGMIANKILSYASKTRVSPTGIKISHTETPESTSNPT